jgi:hypothetical protein
VKKKTGRETTLSEKIVVWPVDPAGLIRLYKPMQRRDFKNGRGFRVEKEMLHPRVWQAITIALQQSSKGELRLWLHKQAGRRASSIIIGI